MTKPKHPRIGETVEVRVRISPEAMKILKRGVMRQDPLNQSSIASTAGRILTKALLEKGVEIKEVKLEQLVDRAKVEAPSTCMQLFLRKFTIAQIAAINRMPYAAVANEIGMATDRMIDREDMPATYGARL